MSTEYHVLLIAAIFVLISFKNEQWMAHRYKHTRTQTSLSCVCVSYQDAHRFTATFKYNVAQIWFYSELTQICEHFLKLPDQKTFTLLTAHDHITAGLSSTPTHPNRSANNSCKSVKAIQIGGFFSPPSRSNQEQMTRCQPTSRANNFCNEALCC